MSSRKVDPCISDVRAYVIDSKGVGGDYHDRADGHWLVDGAISTPMSLYADYRRSRTSWGIAVLGSILVEIELEDRTVGIATGLGGEPACFLIEKHFKRFLVGSDCRDINRLWDQMYRASLPYGRKGLAPAAISVVDLALWDVVGKLRGEPVFNLIGGRVRDEIPAYMTGIRPDVARELGFWGAKVPLPISPAAGPEGMVRNVEALAEYRSMAGQDFPLMVDCYMSLDVPYAVELAARCRSKGVDVHWFEECLNPDDVDGHRLLKERAPLERWTTGEHEYTRYGFRELLRHRAVDILQPDVMWVGGLTELLRVSAMAAAYDVPVVPHGSGNYSYHFVVSQPHSPFVEYLNSSPGSDEVSPVFGGLFVDEAIPVNGKVRVSDAPGFGLELDRRAANLIRPYEA